MSDMLTACDFCQTEYPLEELTLVECQITLRHPPNATPTDREKLDSDMKSIYAEYMADNAPRSSVAPWFQPSAFVCPECKPKVDAKIEQFKRKFKQ
jgi:hypothetical protein